jgi:hypothetical protein
MKENDHDVKNEAALEPQVSCLMSEGSGPSSLADFGLGTSDVRLEALRLAYAACW